jgi:phosphopantetheine adenylyltransferase
MLSFKSFIAILEELGGKEKTDGSVSLKSHKVMAFGRMNPITHGHQAVVNKVHEVAKKHNADHVVIVSHSQDAKKNPLTAAQKVKHAKNAFPGTNVTAASKEHPTILHHAAQAHSTGAQHLHVIAGSDRHEEMHKLLHKYNNVPSAHGHYNFKSITVHSSGERDPDAEGTSGISASKMREHAASGNKTAFHAGAPTGMSAKHKDAMYHDVRRGMRVKD